MDLAMRLIPSSTEDQFEEITIVKDDELKESGLFKQYNSSDYKRIVKEHWGKLNLTLAAFKPPKLTYSISGSNAWVIGKEHSATGRPIMANDPHVGLAIPSIFHPVEMIEIDHNDNIITQAFGAGSDGVPGISIGKSLHFAWGSTSLYADSKDVFVEEILINENGNQSYLCDGKWIPLKIRKEIFKVRGSQDYEEVYPETHRGPLLSNLFIDFHLKYGFPMPNHHEKRLSFQMASYTKDSGKSIKATIDNIFSKTQ
jgi:acyl-homoserine lactone acylase PvdQ